MWCWLLDPPIPPSWGDGLERSSASTLHEVCVLLLPPSTLVLVFCLPSPPSALTAWCTHQALLPECTCRFQKCGADMQFGRPQPNLPHSRQWGDLQFHDSMIRARARLPCCMRYCPVPLPSAAVRARARACCAWCRRSRTRSPRRRARRRCSTTS